MHFPSPDPNMAGFGDSFIRRVAYGRRSLRFSGKKDKSKGCKEEPQSEASSGKEKKEQNEEEEEEVVKPEEIEEAYTLPELPHTPLSGTVTPTGLQGQS